MAALGAAVFFATVFAGAFFPVAFALAAALAGAALAAAFFGLALAGAFAAALAADLRGAAFFALLAGLEALRFPAVLRDFGSGVEPAVATSGFFGDFEATADSAAESAAGAGAFGRDLRVVRGFVSLVVRAIAVFRVHHQTTRIEVRRTRFFVRESTIWQRPLVADSGRTGISRPEGPRSQGSKPRNPRTRWKNRVYHVRGIGCAGSHLLSSESAS